MTNETSEPRRFLASAPFHKVTWDYATDEDAAAMAYAITLFAEHGYGEDLATVRVTETRPTAAIAIGPMRIIRVRRTFTIERES